MFRWILMVLAGLWLFGGLAGCSVSEEAAKGFGALGQAATTTIEGLEKSGSDYDAELFVPGEAQLSWTPFGVRIEMPQSYFRVHIESGRGKGVRPSDAGPPPA